MVATVSLEWAWIDWEHGYTWKSDIVRQLNDEGISEEWSDRCVYVIRANGLFAIEYPTGRSPVVYIGRGNLRNRLQSHRDWMGELEALVRDYSFQIAVALPRVKNNKEAYKECEAALLQEFANLFGSAPLVNRSIENQRYGHRYAKEDLREPLQIGKGVRFEWAISPMPASDLYHAYTKTHRDP